MPKELQNRVQNLEAEVKDLRLQFGFLSDLLSKTVRSEPFYMVPGVPLSEDDKECVESTLYEELKAGRTHWDTAAFLRLLKWPQRRQPDLRDYLEQYPHIVAHALSLRLGKRVEPDFFVSRANMFAKFG